MLEEPCKMSVVPVAIHPQGSLAEPAGVDQARVAQTVDIQDIPVFRQRRDEAQIGLVAGGKDQGGLLALERREALFELAMRVQASGHQSRGACADAVTTDRSDGGFSDSGVCGQVQIIVRGEEQDPMPVKLHFGAGSGVDCAQAAQ